MNKQMKQMSKHKTERFIDIENKQVVFSGGGRGD